MPGYVIGIVSDAAEGFVAPGAVFGYIDEDVSDRFIDENGDPFVLE